MTDCTSASGCHSNVSKRRVVETACFDRLPCCQETVRNTPEERFRGVCGSTVGPLGANSESFPTKGKAELPDLPRSGRPATAVSSRNGAARRCHCLRGSPRHHRPTDVLSAIQQTKY